MRLQWPRRARGAAGALSGPRRRCGGPFAALAAFAAVYALLLQTVFAAVAAGVSAGQHSAAPPEAGVVCTPAGAGQAPSAPHDPHGCGACCPCSPASGAVAPPGQAGAARIAAAVPSLPRATDRAQAQAARGRSAHRPRAPPVV